ncbi:50S ribosomal protein L33 [Ureaplasma diversum]|uniref:Large ribosomal subunit protein bL33 n=1 Tax=Ureaplasma diversum NCTC 246 TaxID=1188241 RepID=A0A084EWR1_9BACT|nr:50S ribosomal protein L33 [Ureaplasma diversum]KEZ22403.1 50S ribosomal protein L33 [Ureaplasma diversum NCTC 246]
MVKKIILVCEVCTSRNYQTQRNKFAINRLVLNKYCKKCNQSTTHKETK